MRVRLDETRLDRGIVEQMVNRGLGAFEGSEFKFTGIEKMKDANMETKK
jgi:hypothetical protein